VVHGLGLRILVAEDNLVNQRLMSRLLEKRGHRVTVVSNGRDALASLARQAYDLVLMDVQMPEMDGLEATAAIRAQEEGTGRHLPILALTAHVMRGDAERCLAAGMDGYLAKPFQADELDAALARLLPGEPSTEPLAAPPVDLSHALAVADEDRVFFEEVVTAFLEEYPQRVATLHTALAAGKAGRLARAAQSLQEVLGRIGASPAMALTAELATLGRAARLEEAAGVLAQLEQELTRIAAVFADPNWWERQASALRLRTAASDTPLPVGGART
jgi:two-component system sensor histidine kinase/response regulator